MFKYFILSLILSGVLYSQAPNEVWMYQDTSISGMSIGNKMIKVDDTYFFTNKYGPWLHLFSINKSGELNWMNANSLMGIQGGWTIPEHIVKNGENYNILIKRDFITKEFMQMQVATISNTGEILENRLDTLNTFPDRINFLSFYYPDELIYLTYTQNYEKLIVSHFDINFNLQNTIELDTTNLVNPISFLYPRSFFINSKNNYMAVHTDVNNKNFVLSEYDSNGNLLQSLSFPKTEKNDGWNFKINEDPQGNYYLSNNTDNFYENFYFFMMKIDEDFNEILSKDIFLGEDRQVQGGYYNEEKNTFLVYGSKDNLESDDNKIRYSMYIAEISNEGEILLENFWKHYNPNPVVLTNDHVIYDLDMADNGNIIVYALSYHGLYMAEIELVPTSVEDNYTSENNFLIHPNPASDYIEISLGSHSVNKGLQPLVHGGEIAIYDVLGENVMTVETRYALSLQRIDISPLPRGVYFVRIGERVEKFVKK